MIDFPSLKTLTIGNESFKQVTSFTINTLPSLESIEIGNNCFKSIASNVALYNFPELISLKIGRNSFYDKSNDQPINKIFQIQNNSKLLSIEIGEYSFSTFGILHYKIWQLVQLKMNLTISWILPVSLLRVLSIYVID